MTDKALGYSTPAADRVAPKTDSEHSYRPKKGRPTAAQVSAIDNAILAAATKCFFDVGYNSASMEAITIAAGVSTGTLYSRYANKEALFQAVVKERIAALSVETSNKRKKSGDSLEQCLKHHATTVMTRGISAESRSFDRLLGGASGISLKLARALYDMRFERVVNLIAGDILECTRAEGRPARNPKRIAEGLMMCFAGWISIQTSLRVVSQREAVQFGNRMVDILIAGRSGW